MGRARGHAETKLAPPPYDPGTAASWRVRGGQQRRSDSTRGARLYSASESVHCHCCCCTSASRTCASASPGSSSSAFRAALITFGRTSPGGTPLKTVASLSLRVCHTEVSQCKRLIFPGCLLKVGNTLFDLGPAVAFGKPTFEIALRYFRRDGTHCGKSFVFFPSDRDLDFSRDGLRHVALQSKHVSHQDALSRTRKSYFGLRDTARKEFRLSCEMCQSFNF